LPLRKAEPQKLEVGKAKPEKKDTDSGNDVKEFSHSSRPGYRLLLC
jgi:hypothetical protein